MYRNLLLATLVLYFVFGERTAIADQPPIIVKLRNAHKDLKVIAELSVGTESAVRTLASKAGVGGVAADIAVRVLDKVVQKYLHKKGRKQSTLKFSDFSVAIIYSRDLKNKYNNPGFALIISEVSPLHKATNFGDSGAIGFDSKGGVYSSLGDISIGDTSGKPVFSFGVILAH